MEKLLKSSAEMTESAALGWESHGRASSPGFVLFLLRLATSLLFIGRGWLYAKHMSPFSQFFWREDWLEKPLERWFGIDWEFYAANSEGFIRSMESMCGGYLIFCGVLCWFYRPGRRIIGGILLAGAILLATFWFLKWTEVDWQFAMLIEHFLQWMPPILLVAYRRIRFGWWFGVASAATVLTFAGHGLYALGWLVPLNNEFIFMTSKILGTDVEASILFLRVAGWLDLALVPLVFIPWTRVPALAYAAFWGIITALARLPVYLGPAEEAYGLHPWLAECAVRIPHGLIPLALLVLVASNSKMYGFVKHQIFRRSTKRDQPDTAHA